jgi:rhodanese-related sulfurtransferase
MHADAVWENLSDGDADNDPVIVSVRSPEHYAVGHVPGAINIPWRSVAASENLAKLSPDEKIVAYCYTGHTGQVAATVLGMLGYDVSNVKYGMMGWTEDDEVFAQTRFGPDVQRDYPVDSAAEMAMERACSTAGHRCARFPLVVGGAGSWSELARSWRGPAPAPGGGCLRL